MSEIDCFGDGISLGEVVPGWWLVQLVNLKPTNKVDYVVNGFVMKEGSYGLTNCNDPSFVFDMEPQAEVTDCCTDEEWSVYEPMMEHYMTRLTGPVEDSYRLVNSSIEAGYNPDDGGFACWLADRMFKTLKKYRQELT